MFFRALGGHPHHGRHHFTSYHRRHQDGDGKNKSQADAKGDDDKSKDGESAKQSDKPAGDAPKDARGGDGSRPSREQMREAMLKRFDQDKDGTLSDEERAAARKAFEARRGGGPGNRGPRGGGRGFGKGGPDREKMRAEMLKRFDKDNDGKLSDEERAEMRKQFEARRGGHGRGGDRSQPKEPKSTDQNKSDGDSKPDESNK